MQVGGATVIGDGNWANFVPRDASAMYASNMFNLVEDSWDEESKAFKVDFDHDILPGCVITHDGQIINETIKNILEGGS